MLNETTMTKLQEMKLGVMAKALRNQMEDSDFNNMPFEERLGLIVDAEWTARKNNRLKRLIKNAGYEFPVLTQERVFKNFTKIKRVLNLCEMQT